MSESNLRNQYLNALGIEQWVLQQTQQTIHSEPSSDHQETPSEEQAVLDIKDCDWPELAVRVSNCTACDLHCSRTQTVFGVGNQTSDWLIIGEAPGADEDAQGEPFVGRAGRLLNAMLAAIGLTREQVFITNVLKCRPPNNRDPQPAEIEQCQAFLQRQIELLSPKLILVVGRIAAQHLLQTQQAVGRLRGKVHRLFASDIPLVVTYHPAYLLRKPIEKRKAWQDLQLACQVLQQIATTDSE